MKNVRFRLAATIFVCAVAIACAQSDSDFAGKGASLFGNRPTKAPDFVSLAKNLQPAIVNVSAMLTPKGKGTPGGQRPGFGEEFFGMPSPDGPERSQGSGFIIEPDGVILTNAHVIEGAKKIIVRLVDKSEFEANVIGKDLPTDIALLKITAKEPLPTLAMGDSDDLQVGEWIMAVGNPFGLDSSVSSGIISAKGRHLGQAYDRLIQTDASLNPGSSGGPLVNLNGRVVGISKAIVSQGGGNIGISFATPINLVKEILPQLRASGKVTRGWAGVAVQELTPGLADTLGMKKPSGALVAGVVQGGPAQRGGMKVGDVIIEFDGKEVIDAMDLPLWIARTPVDKSVAVKVQREQQQVKLQLTVTAMPEGNPMQTRGNEIG
ncbi:MAG: trypsin-like peptidase domain-containing protein [Candidatus Binatia bacterium]